MEKFISRPIEYATRKVLRSVRNHPIMLHGCYMGLCSLRELVNLKHDAEFCRKVSHKAGPGAENTAREAATGRRQESNLYIGGERGLVISALAPMVSWI